MNLNEIINQYNENNYIYLYHQVPQEKKEECFNLIVEKLKLQNKLLDINKYIVELSPELRLKYINLYDFEQYNSYKSIIEGVNDDEIVYKLLTHALNAEKHDFYIAYMFQEVPKKYKEKFLYLIQEKEKTLQKNIISDFRMNEYILGFDIEQRPHIIKDILFKNFNYDYDSKKNDRIGQHHYKDILQTVIEDGVSIKESKMYDILLFIFDEQTKILDEDSKTHKKIYNLEPIIHVFLDNGYDIKEVIKAVIDKDAAESYVITQINEKLPEKIKKDFTMYTIDYCISQGKKIDDFHFYTFIQNLNKEDCIELFYKYVIKEKVYDYTFVLQKMNSCLFFANQLFSLMSQEEINKNFENINRSLLLNEREFKFSVGYENLIKVYAEKYGVNYSGLYKFIQNFGFVTLKYLLNEKIREYINLPIDKLEKLLKIFNNNNYYFDKSIKNDIINSLYQREFMMKEKDTYNIFSQFEMLISNNDSLGVNNLLEFIQNSYDINIILKKNNISYEDFFHQTINGNLDILHQITDKFIALKREEYIKEKLVDVDKVLTMDRVISRESYKKDLIENSSYMISYYLKDLNKNLFSKEQLVLVEDKQILHDIIEFKKNPKEYLLNPEYRKYLTKFNEILDILYDNEKGFYSYDPDSEKQKHLQFNYVQQKVNSNYLLGILLESNYKGICNVIDNENLYIKLNEFLYKYKIIGWQYTFNNILSSCSMDYNEGTIAGLLSNFDKIVDKIENKATLTSIIDYSNCYSSYSKVYSLLFGRENFNLIAANSGKNKASMAKAERLKKNLELVNKMYEREYITTPPMDQTLVLENGKNITVVLGNTTNMMNLTYGERTNSCMRQGGAFNDLFYYCIENENGFHIRFSNPRTGNFVSRVSGLRNSNTIFLNELRNSEDENFNNDDLYLAIKKVAEYLIYASKNSSIPIDNVIITTDYALKSKKEEKQELCLNIDERKKALQGISFNYDSTGLVLATTNEDNSLVHYNFDIDLPKYSMKRDSVKIYKGQSAIERIIQLKMINELLNGKNIEDINIENFKEQCDYLISGEDFYVSFLDGKPNIFVCDKSKENYRTINEIKKILNSNYNFEDSQVRSIIL